MPSTDTYSVLDLERMLEETRNELEELNEKRDQLSADLAEVESRIFALSGNTGTVASSATITTNGAAKTKKVTRRTKSSSKKRGGAKRIAGQPSLRKLIMQLLPKFKKPLTLDEVMDKVLETGYRSNAKDFRQVVYLNLYNMTNKGEVVHDTEARTYTAA